MTPQEYLAAHRDQSLRDLTEFLAIPSISGITSHAADVRAAAEWLRARLERSGLESARVEETGGHPVVTARTPHRPHRPTVLVYGHYDVQPVDPLASWTSPPFAPVVRDGKLFGRGAADDKGQLYMHVLAAEACLATDSLPVNLIFLFEGEEESGSEHLAAFIAQEQSRLGADVAVISDTPMFRADMPAICYGLRGLTAFEVRVDGPRQDLHSGVFGGAVANPAHVLAALLASLHTADGRVAVDGFYDDVRVLPAAERDALASLPFDAAEFLSETGSPTLFGEPGCSTLERTWTRPTLDVNGMWSGFTGEGRKTIIPAYAAAKLSARLVPHQDPAHVAASVTRHLSERCPDSVRLTVDALPGDRAVLTPLHHPVVAAARGAIRRVYGKDPVNILMGGSIPIVVTFEQVLRAPTLLLGFALPEEHFHAPNEFFTLANFWRGQETIAALWQGLADWTVPTVDGMSAQ